MAPSMGLPSEIIAKGYCVQEKTYEVTTRLTAQQIITALCAALGRKLVAIIGGAKATSTLTEWANGKVESEQMERLQLALEVVYLLRSIGEKDDMLKVHFYREIISFESEAIALVIRDGPPKDVRQKVLKAASESFSELRYN